MRLLSEAVSMEQQLESFRQKLDDLAAPKLSGVFEALQAVRERIDSIFSLKDRLPDELRRSQEVVSSFKTRLVECMARAKVDAEKGKADIEAGKYEESLGEPEDVVVPPELGTEAQKACIEVQTNVRELFQSLGSLQRSFHLGTISEEEKRVPTEDISRSSRTQSCPSQNESPHDGNTAGEGLNMHFLPLLYLADLRPLFKDLPNTGTVYVLGVKGGFQSAEFASLMYDLGECAKKADRQIAGITLDHMYFPDPALPFKSLFQSVPSLRTLRLVSCPFTTSQLQSIVARLAEAGHPLERLDVENALMGESPAELVQTINMTGIRALRLANPRMKMGKFVETVRELISDQVEVVDFGVFKADPRTREMLREWQKSRRVTFVDDQTSQITRYTYKY